MYAVVSGIKKPEGLGKKPAGTSKYPLADMKVGESFVVPYTDMNKGEEPSAFRDRIYKSARNYALRDFNTRKADAAAGEEVTKKDFSAALMTQDDTADTKLYATGDVVVWRDA